MSDENLMLPFSEACERNKGPILEVLKQALVGRLQVLEIGSGTGQHAVHFAANLKDLVWQPSERLAHLSALQSRVRLQGGANLRAPALLDVNQKIWPVRSVDAVFSANTLHIVSWGEVKAMFTGIDAVLKARGTVAVYGPFRYQGRHTSPSNERFDAELRERDPKSGVRDIEAVCEVAATCRLKLNADHELPANNRLLLFERID